MDPHWDGRMPAFDRNRFELVDTSDPAEPWLKRFEIRERLTAMDSRAEIDRVFADYDRRMRRHESDFRSAVKADVRRAFRVYIGAAVGAALLALVVGLLM